MTLLIPRLIAYLGFRRRWVAAVLVGLAVLALGAAWTPRQPGMVNALVLRHDVAAGQTLKSSDVDVRAVPRTLLPGKPLTSASLTRCVAAGPIPQSAVLAENHCATETLSPQPGLVLSPVRLADPAALSLLRAGSVVDVWGTLDGGTQALATHARVAAVPAAEKGTGLGAKPGDPIVVVETSPEQAKALAAAAGRAKLSVSIPSG